MTAFRKKRRLLLPALLAALLAAGVAAPPRQAEAAGCRLRFDALPRATFVERYDAFSGKERETRFDLTVRRENAGCAFAVGADRGLSAGGSRGMSMGSGRLAYEFFTGANRKTILRDAGSGGTESLLIGSFNGNRETVSLDFSGVIGEGQITPAGSYSDSVVFVLYELEGGQPGAVLDTRPVRVSAEVAPVAHFAVEIDGARRNLQGRLGTLDFGELRAGERLGFDIEASGNTAYDIELESANRGMLEGYGEAKDEQVPYNLILDGRLLDLRGGARMPMQAATSSGRTANRHRVEVEIGSLSKAAAGKYRDELTLTITTR